MPELICVDELLLEWERLADTSQIQNGYYTTPELMKLLGKSVARTREIIREGVKSGKVLHGKRIVDPDWNGKRHIYDVYKMRKEGESE